MDPYGNFDDDDGSLSLLRFMAIVVVAQVFLLTALWVGLSHIGAP